MIHTCHQINNCKFCTFISRSMGHPLMFVLHKKWNKLKKDQVFGHMRGLNLELVGGLVNRGWTIHDIDVVGNAKDVPTFVDRLERGGITNPVHLCDTHLRFKSHSHFFCLLDGLKLILFENKPFEKASVEIKK